MLANLNSLNDQECPASIPADSAPSTIIVGRKINNMYQFKYAWTEGENLYKASFS